MLQNYWKFPIRNIQKFGFVYHDTNGLNHGPVWKTQSFLLSEICMVILWQDCYGKGNLKKSYCSTDGRRFPIGNAYSYTVKRVFLSVYVDDIKLAEKKQNIDPMWSVINKEVDLGRTNIFPWSCIPGMYSKTLWNKQRYYWQLQNHVWIQNFSRSNWKITMLGKSVYLFVVPRHGGSCQEMCGTILWVGKQDDSTTLQSIYSMHWWPSFQRRKIEICRRIVTSMLWIVLKCLFLARIGRPDIPWSVNKLARSITKWTKACDKRLCRLISYIHHTCELKQYCHVGNTAKQCRLGLFQDSDFAGDLVDSKSTSGGTLCVFFEVIHLFQSVGCVGHKLQFRTVQQNQKSFLWMQDWGWMVSPALDLWDLIVAVLGNTNQSHKERRDPLMKNVKFVQHLTQFKNENNLREWSMIWTMSILFPQTSTLLIKKLCCTCLKTTKQWSRWF